MKITKIARGFLAIAVLVGVALVSTTAEAIHYPYSGLGPDDCVVTSRFWGTVSSPKLTLGVAMEYANADPAYRLCKDRIFLNPEGGEIMLRQPLVIKLGGETTWSKVESGGGVEAALEGDFFEIIGATDVQTDANHQVTSYTPQEIILDASGIRDWKGEQCAVVIKGASTAFRNIKLVRVPDGYDGICVEDINSVMDAVTVFSAKGGDAFAFGPTASHNWILPNSSAQGITGKGIRVDNPNDEHGNRFIPTNKLAGATDIDGFATLGNPQTVDEILLASANATATVSHYFDITTFDARDLIDAAVDAHVQLWDVRSTGDGKVLVRGAVVRGDPNDCSADLVRKVVRLQVYEVNNTVPGFYGYVSDFDSTFGRGLIKEGMTANGTFMFNMPANGQQIIIVPELTGNGIGPASDLIDIADDPTQVQCQGRTAGINTGGGGTGGHPGVGRKMFHSKAECILVRNLEYVGSGQGLPAYGYDTDGDNLFDDQEDVNRNCRCDADETCWYMPDTDNDGVQDDRESPTNDVDGDGMVNNIDSDSDNDGLKDGQEDRNYYIYTTSASGTTHTQNFLYRFESVFSPYPIQKRDGTGPVTCSLGANDILGVRYMWYKVMSDQDPEPYYGDFPTENPESFDIDVFVCRNQSLNAPLNFNGVHDTDNAELKFEDRDTDADGWCDGHGSACAGIQYGNDDACPLIANDPADQNQCKGELECYPKQMFYGVDPRYVEWDTEGSPLNLRDSGKVKVAELIETQDDEGNLVTTVVIKEVDANDGSIGGNGIPDVYEVDGGYAQIEVLCGDIDKDGIPGCVENPSGRCSGECGSPVERGPDDLIGLRHYCADTDGDGLIDGWKGYENSDVCPAKNGGGGLDRFADGKTNYSCEEELLYQSRPVLAYFLDRDNDRIRDGEEDKDLNGLYDNVVEGVEGIGITESNALSTDSDKDGVGDKLEIAGWIMPTNPADPDTDGDMLTDAEEDRNWDGMSEHQINFEPGQGEEGCPEALFRDTDPTNPDSDGDGLLDGVEDGKGRPLVVGEDFIRQVLDLETWSSGGIPMVSDPTTADSDNDGLSDDEEYNGSIIKYYDSNPCMRDSDGDSRDDVDENPGCRLNPDPLCQGSPDKDTSGGVDSDGDGLADDIEAKLGTDPSNPDSDGDGIWDGGEDINHNGIYEPHLGEADALNPDTDGDSLTDGMESRYGSDPTNIDTDGDCIPDGIEDANRNGYFDMGAETNAISADTDGDQLPDGWVAGSGMGEDLNCNGIRDTDADGRFTETDPRNPDSDLDGYTDFEEMMFGGYYNIANVNRATTGREGCQLVAGTGLAPTSMYYLFGMLMLATRFAARRMRKRPCLREERETE